MKLLQGTNGNVLMELTQDELRALRQAMNEVCNGIRIPVWEFSTRLGITREDARKLLKALKRQE